MSSAQPELKESLRRRDSAVGDGSGSPRGVAALLHSFAEGRSRPKPKEQEAGFQRPVHRQGVRPPAFGSSTM